MNEDEIRELFREMRDEPLPPDSLARVRMAVTARTSGAKRWKAARPWAAALLVTACVAMVFFSPRPTAPPAPPADVAKQVLIAVPREPQPTPSTKVESPKTARAPIKRKPPTRPKQDLAIRVETEDPDVVLFFLPDKSAE
jgi:hypothetical protein